MWCYEVFYTVSVGGGGGGRGGGGGGGDPGGRKGPFPPHRPRGVAQWNAMRVVHCCGVHCNAPLADGDAHLQVRRGTYSAGTGARKVACLYGPYMRPEFTRTRIRQEPRPTGQVDVHRWEGSTMASAGTTGALSAASAGDDDAGGGSALAPGLSVVELEVGSRGNPACSYCPVAPDPRPAGPGPRARQGVPHTAGA